MFIGMNSGGIKGHSSHFWPNGLPGHLTNVCACHAYAGGVVTLTSNAQSAVCPGEEVTLTCTLTEGVSLEWNSPAFNPEIRYLDNSPVGIPTQRGIFTATLISSIPTPTPSLFDFTSTLRVTATPDPDAMLNGTVITCTDQLNPMSTTLTIAGSSLSYKLYE